MSEIVRLEIKLMNGDTLVIGVDGSDPQQALRDFLSTIENEKWVHTSQANAQVAFPVDKIVQVYASSD